jgi:hypothetical protein
MRTQQLDWIQVLLTLAIASTMIFFASVIFSLGGVDKFDPVPS